MLSWFQVPPPLVTSEKAWTERQMRRLADQFGIERLSDAEFLIPDEYGEEYDGSDEHARDIFDDVCEAMNVPPGELRFEILEDVQLPGAAGHYDSERRAGKSSDRAPSNTAGDQAAVASPVVRVGRSQLDDLCRLTATIAHEVSHHRLLGGGFQRGDEPDLEPTTDLLPIFFGYGVFMANATVRFQEARTGNIEHWSISRRGYLPSRIFGYALALAAGFRGEFRPRWSQALRPDAQDSFERGDRYLASGDTLFHPDTYRASAPPPDKAELLGRLRGGTPTFRFDALAELEERLSAGSLQLADSETAEVIRLVRDRDVDVAAGAARTLSACGSVSVAIRDELQRAAWFLKTPVRGAAIRALGRLGVSDSEFLDTLCRLSSSQHIEVVSAVAAAAACLGRQAESLALPLLKMLEQANIHADGSLASAAAGALAAVIADPAAAVRAHYVGRDPELQVMALDALRAVERSED